MSDALLQMFNGQSSQPFQEETKGGAMIATALTERLFDSEDLNESIPGLQVPIHLSSPILFVRRPLSTFTPKFVHQLATKHVKLWLR